MMALAGPRALSSVGRALPLHGRCRRFEPVSAHQPPPPLCSFGRRQPGRSRMAKKTYHGSCHCGAVRYEADIDLAQGTGKCNCSICKKTRAWLAGVPAADFRLLAGEDALREYQFGRKRLHHLFCGTCGVRSFSRGPDGKGGEMYALRVNCLDGVDPAELIAAPVRYFNMAHDDMKSPPAETRHL